MTQYYNMDTLEAAQSYEDLKVMADVPRFHSKHCPDRVAMIYEGRETTYQDFDNHSTQLANGMIAEGVEEQKRVAYLDVNTDYFFELLFGCGKANTVMCAVNWRLAPPEVEYIINDAEAELLFVGERFYDIVEAIKDKIPSVKKIITLSGNHSQWSSLENWRDSQSKVDPNISIKESDIAIQMYTSGTTGHPKGVEISNAALFASSVDGSEETKWNEWTPEDVSLVAMPCFHVGGSRWGIMGLIPGCLNIIIPEFDPAKVLSIIQGYKVTKIFMVPAAMQFILMLPQARETDYSSVDYILYGASPIPLDLLREAIEVFQCGFIQLYGMTETCGSATFLPAADHCVEGNERMKSAGKPLPFVEVCVKGDDGHVLPPREVGEICIKSPSNMSSYWKLPEATDKTMVDGWIHTGDAGYTDEDGYVYVYDRVKDMIVSGGENIYPAEIESAMFGHPAIADVAVIGVPDDKWGEAAKAVVVLKEGVEATAEDILAFTREKIAGFKIPKSVDFIAELPRNPSGKLLKKDLRAPYWEGRERNVN